MSNSDISIFTALENVLGLKPSGMKETRKYLCWQHPDSTPSLVAYGRVNRCKCEAGCLINGRVWADAIDVIQHGTTMTMNEAREKLNAAPVVPVYRYQEVPRTGVNAKVIQTYTKHLSEALPYYRSRGISDGYTQKWSLGCSPSYRPKTDQIKFTHGPLAGEKISYFACRRFVIPTLRHEPETKVFSVTFRLDDVQAKERLLAIPNDVMRSAEETLDASGRSDLINFLFGAKYRTWGSTGIFQMWTVAGWVNGLPELFRREICFVSEGQFDAINLYEASGHAAIGTKEHRQLANLLQNVERIIMVRDSGGPGRKIAHATAKSIGRSDVEFVDPLPGFKDVNEMKTAGRLDEWLNDVVGLSPIKDRLAI